MIRFTAKQREGVTITNESNAATKFVVKLPKIGRAYSNELSIPNLSLPATETFVRVTTTDSKIFVITSSGTSYFQRQLNYGSVVSDTMAWGSKVSYDFYTPSEANFYPYIITGLTNDDYTVMLGMIDSSNTLFRITFNVTNRVLVSSVEYLGTSQLLNTVFSVPVESGLSLSYTESNIAKLSTQLQGQITTLNDAITTLNAKVANIESIIQSQDLVSRFISR